MGLYFSIEFGKRVDGHYKQTDELTVYSVGTAKQNFQHIVMKNQ